MYCTANGSQLEMRCRGSSAVRHLAVLAFAAGMMAAPLALDAQLPRRAVRTLDSLLDSPPFDRALWGVALVDERGRLLYGRNHDRLFIPASNTKLVVTAVATALLPPDWTVTTSVYPAGTVESGTLHGDLVLYGRGDPTMGRRCYATDTTQAGTCDLDPFARLRSLAEQIAGRGIRVIDGDLVGDGSWFDGQLVHPQWSVFNVNWWFAAPVAGLGFNDNSVDITWRPGPAEGAPALLSFRPDLGDFTLENRTTTVAAGGESDVGDRMFRQEGTLRVWAEGTVALDSRGGTESYAMPDPSLFTARAFRRALAEAGISVSGTTRSNADSNRYRAAREAPPLAEAVSRPLRDWIFPILNTSQNWYADMLLKQLGRQFGAAGSWREGLMVERRFLIDSVGLDSTLFALSDGSGLSSSNLVAPIAFAGLIRHIRSHPNFGASFRPGLPQSGAVGSLRRRFVGTPLEGRVFAKTGSIDRVNTISGWFELQNGKSYTFSVQANHHAEGDRATLARIDSIVVAMARAVEKRR